MHSRVFEKNHYHIIEFSSRFYCIFPKKIRSLSFVKNSQFKKSLPILTSFCNPCPFRPSGDITPLPTVLGAPLPVSLRRKPHFTLPRPSGDIPPLPSVLGAPLPVNLTRKPNFTLPPTPTKTTSRPTSSCPTPVPFLTFEALQKISR